MGEGFGIGWNRMGWDYYVSTRSLAKGVMDHHLAQPLSRGLNNIDNSFIIREPWYSDFFPHSRTWWGLTKPDYVGKRDGGYRNL